MKRQQSINLQQNNFFDQFSTLITTSTVLKDRK